MTSFVLLPGASLGQSGTQYTIQQGDSLFNIATKNGLTLQQLIAANPSITDPTSILPGQVINIPAGAHGLSFPHLPLLQLVPAEPVKRSARA